MTCPQCQHPEHPPAKEILGMEELYVEGGCTYIAYSVPLRDIIFSIEELSGIYHEHCDCDYDPSKVSQ